MPDDLWYQAEENSRMRGEYSLWIRCQFCKDPFINEHVVAWNPGDDVTRLVGILKKSIFFLIKTPSFQTLTKSVSLTDINSFHEF